MNYQSPSDAITINLCSNIKENKYVFVSKTIKFKVH